MPACQRLRPVVSCVLALLLTACDPFSDAKPMMGEYLERLARVLETPVPQADQSLPPASVIPRTRERALQVPSLELGMLDFLSLYGCELQFIVGERNSVMGRVMQPLNRLRYEIRFIRAAEECIAEVEDESLEQILQTAVQSKRDSLPLAVWNATWGTEEVEQLLTLSKGFYPVAPEQNPVSDLVLDLRQLNQTVSALLNGQLDASLDGLGGIHQRWQAEFRAGQIINSGRLLIKTLNQGTEIIRSRLGERPLCLNGKSNNQAAIVQSFFLSVYIAKVQPYMSDVSRARHSLIAALAELARRQQEVMPESFRLWYQRHLLEESETSLWRQLDQAMASHTRHWQELLEQCGMRPG